MNNINPESFDVLVQDNDETGELELFIVMDLSILQPSDSAIAVINIDGIVISNDVFNIPGFLKKVLEQDKPIHKNICLISIDDKGEDVAQHEIPISVLSHKTTAKPA